MRVAYHFEMNQTELNWTGKCACLVSYKLALVVISPTSLFFCRWKGGVHMGFSMHVDLAVLSWTELNWTELANMSA